MSAQLHQSAIRILFAARQADPLQVDALIARHERECVAEMAEEAAAGQLTCPPCTRNCSQGLTCPARQQKNG
jgi:hypothetical protein